MTKNKLLSVIIPVYNAEDFFERCIESILNSSYQNIEIIVVNDGSEGNIDELIKPYTEAYENVKYVCHEKNKGLYQARITGVESSTGDYIAFVDSDDYVGVDFFRLLMKKGEESNADIVVGKTIMDLDGNKVVYNMALLEKELNGKEVIEHYFNQRGQNYFIHVIWGKIYSRSLWERALCALKKQTMHLVMTEDFAFSSILHYYAQKEVFTKHEGYFYYKHENASTNLKNNTKEQIFKKVKHIKIAYDFVEDFLTENNCYETYEESFLDWKRTILHNYFKTHRDFARCGKEFVNSLLKNKLEEAEILNDKYGDVFFYSVVTPWDSGLEELKKKIITKKPKYLSFDIFDTLVLRPFEIPSDLFILLNKTFEELYNPHTFVDFSEIRKSAERMARKKQSVKNPLCEEITIEDIYECLRDDYLVPENVCNVLMKKEQELEIKYCYRRETAYEIYEIAKALGIEVICISDMYLSKEVIKQILYKNGYTDIKKIYISSEYKGTKWTGNLFKMVKSHLKLPKTDIIIHIGDNYESDYIKANENGYMGIHLPRAIDAMNTRTSGILSELFRVPLGGAQNFGQCQSFFAMRCIKALIANKYFDNPHTHFLYDSDFNCDPFLVGYAALGPAMVGLTRWMTEDAINKGYERIQFLARDGYLPKLVYDKMSYLYKGAPESGYFYMSRKSMLPYIVQEKLDIYQLKIMVNVFTHTPIDFVKYLFDDEYIDKIAEILKSKNVTCDKCFNNMEEYYVFCNIITENVISVYPIRKAEDKILELFEKSFAGKTVCFDVGYSARPQAVLSCILNKPVDTYFLHTNTDETFQYSKRMGFEVNTFYDYTPSIIGVMREHLVSSSGPSCIGYSKDGCPLFAEGSKPYTDTAIIEQIHQGCLKFVDDILMFFGDIWENFDFRNQDMSILLDRYLNSPKPIDMQLFAGTIFEDAIGMGDDANVRDFWSKDLAEKKMNMVAVHLDSVSETMKWLTYNRNIIVKTLSYAMFDRKTLKMLAKNKLKDRPLLLHVSGASYRFARGIKNLIRHHSWYK